MEALRKVASNSNKMGFEGMGCIHPAQIALIHESFNPSPKEIEKAKSIVRAFEEAQKKGIGVIAVGSKMIDAPIVKRALQTIDQAVRSGLLNQNWRDNYEG
jgi:citrate lyase subunit beta / citryl-CoA lyase